MPNASLIDHLNNSPLGDPDTVLHRLRIDDAFVDTVANYWMAEHRAEISRLAKGVVVVIDLVSGRYLTATSRLAGLHAFEAEFGRNQTIGWLHEVGGGIVIGGGLGQNIRRS
jgi:hypothetical protein